MIPQYDRPPHGFKEAEEFANRRSRWQGVWITRSIQRYDEKTNQKETFVNYQCSICSSSFHGDYLFPTKFCPNCGADMRNQNSTIGGASIVKI